MSLNLLLFLTESNDHPHHVADPLWKATFIMAHSNDSRLVASPSASCTLHVQSVFNSLWPTRHWLTLAPLSIFSFWTIVTLNTTKVFQFMGHNSVHEPVISNAQVLQNVSILTFLVLGILRNFLWHFSSKQQLRFLVLGILRIFLLDFTSKQQLRAHGQQKGRENPGLLTLKYGQGAVCFHTCVCCREQKARKTEYWWFHHDIPATHRMRWTTRWDKMLLSELKIWSI